MATVIRKQKLGKNDIQFYTAASPTYSRTTSTGGATTITALAATHIPLVQGAASLYFSANNVQRAVTETVARFIKPGHSLATYGAGAAPGDHTTVFGYRNALAATSIQAAASNMFLSEGVARIMVPGGTYTVATPILLPRNTVMIGNGAKTIFRASSTIQTSSVFKIAGTVGATTSNLSANATINTSTVAVADGTKFARGQWVKVATTSFAELQRIQSISGNTLTMNGRFRRTYSATATARSVTIAYPGRFDWDRLHIQGTSATQGIGITMGTMVQGRLGEEVDISGMAQAGIKATLCDSNQLEMAIQHPSSVSAGKGYGVWLAGNANADNKLSGLRNGPTKDVNESGPGNYEWGTIFRGTASASNLLGLWGAATTLTNQYPTISVSATTANKIINSVTSLVATTGPIIFSNKLTSGIATTGPIVYSNKLTSGVATTGPNRYWEKYQRASATNISTRGVAISNENTGYTNDGSYSDIPNLRVTITTTGRPVFITLMASGDAGNESFIGVAEVGTASKADITSNYRIVRDSTTIATFAFLQFFPTSTAGNHGFVSAPGTITYIDVVAAGTYAYKLQGSGSTGTMEAATAYCKLAAFEL